MNMHCLAASLCLALLAGGEPPAAPWNGSGHRIVSLLVWEQLDPATQKEIATLLRSHPRFAEDLQLGLPDDADEATAARHAFALASTWPDTVRSLSHPMHRSANHPRWHYVDLPFAVGGQKVEPAHANAGGDPQDVLAAIAKNVADLGNRDLPAGDRAIALCWVVHLIEDVHQPLHACTLYSPQFPHGDKGGNSFFVTRNVFDPDSRTNLHALWDSLLGDYQLPAWEDCVVGGLRQRPDVARERFAAQLAEHDPKVWAQESHDLGVQFAYRNGELKGTAADAKDKPPPLPEGYLAIAEEVAMRRAALASYRLVDVLERVLAPR